MTDAPMPLGIAMVTFFPKGGVTVATMRAAMSRRAALAKCLKNNKQAASKFTDCSRYTPSYSGQFRAFSERIGGAA